MRLWYNGRPIDTGTNRDAGSRLAVTINGPTITYFPRQGSVLSTTPGGSRTYIDRAVNSNAGCPSRPFLAFGTWHITP